MAEALASEIAKFFGEKLGSRALTELEFATDINSHMKNLQNTKIAIEAFLLDAHTVQSLNRAEQLFLERLSSARDKVDDFCDAKAAIEKMREVMGGSWIKKQVYSFFSTSSNPVVSPFRDARKVKTIRKELDSIFKDYAQFGNLLSMLSVTMSQTSRPTRSETGSYIINEDVIGRDWDRDNIISMLFDSSSKEVQHALSVVSIVGIGGIGKSTLAKYVYNDERVKFNFHVRLWVYATHDFNIKEMLQKILASATDEKPLHCEMDQLQRRFLKQISGKRYLLVLDNIWDHPSLASNWEELRDLLVSGAPGSKVLITTRSESVARRVGTNTEPYRLMDLGDEDSWRLFQKFAFRPWQEQGVAEIGKEIAKTCRNVPLVIRTIGGLLAEKLTVKDWRAFRDDKFANLSLYGHNILQSLKPSYDELDPSLKLCFAYCSLFPKGFEFRKHELINVFIGLGYVVKKYENQSLVDAGEECVLSLVNRRFFNNVEKDGLGCIMSFTMHDLIRDLVVSMAGCKYKMVDSETPEFDERVRHVCFSKEAHIHLDSLSKAKHLQSLQFLGIRSSHTKLKGFSKFFPYLRVLSLQGLKMQDMPRSVCKLIHLRYLDLSMNDFYKLPKAFTQLVNLHSLNLSRCSSLEELPKGMSRMVNLQHLQLSCCWKLRQTPCRIGNLTNLQTLDEFVAGHPNPSDVDGGFSELSKLNNLEGKLKIVLRGYQGESRAANLQMREKLMALCIDFNLAKGKHEKVLEGLQPHANLRGLGIWGYKGKSLPSWMMKNQLHCSLPNLVKIAIFCSKRCKHVCSFGRLPHLQFLLLVRLDSVEYMEDEEEEDRWPTTTRSSGGEREREGILENTTPLFPRLEQLELHDMPQLKGWRRRSSTRLRTPTFPRLKDLTLQGVGIEEVPDEFRGVSSLQSLSILECEELKEIAEWIEEFTSLKTLRIFSCPKLMPLPKQIGNLPNLEMIEIQECAGAFEEWWEDPTFPDCPFNHLASHIKWESYSGRHAFRYCKFRKHELINVFIGEGYVVQKYKNQSLVHAGDGCVLSLVDRRFFNNVEKDGLGCIMSFMMHDLTHDLAVSIPETNEFDERVHHVCFSKEAHIHLDSLWKAKHLQSLQFFGISSSHPKLTAFSKNFQYLKALILAGLKMQDLPRSICKLIHLSYLDLSNNDFRKLPNALTELVNLLYLNLSGCSSLEELPKG